MMRILMVAAAGLLGVGIGMLAVNGRCVDDVPPAYASSPENLQCGLRYATTLPFTTIAGLTVAFQALLAGEALVAPAAPDPAALLATLLAARATNVSLPPLLAQLVLRAAQDPRTPRPEDLLFVGIGGGPVPAALPEALESTLGCAVAVGYGTTEAGGALTMGKISDPPVVRHGTAGRALSVV